MNKTKSIKPKPNLTRKGRKTIAVLVIAILAMAIGACAYIWHNNIVSNRVAATVNDTYTLSEDEVTQYIQDFRSAMELEDDSSWAQYLVDHGWTPEYLRSNAITFLAQKHVIESKASESGLEITDDMLADREASIKDEYDMNDLEFMDYMKELGYTENNYKEYLREQIIDQYLLQSMSADANDDKIIARANQYRDGLDNDKHVTIFSCDNEAAANAAISALSSSESPDSLSVDGARLEYVGFTAFGTYDQAIANMIEEMEAGQTSLPFKGEKDQSYFIVKVDYSIAYPPDGYTSIEQMPKDLLQLLKVMVNGEQQQQALSDFKKNISDTISIRTTNMPAGLPYDVSLDGYVKTNNSEDNHDISSNSEDIPMQSNKNEITDNRSGEDVQLTVDSNGNIVSGAESLFGDTEGQGTASVEIID